MNLTKEKWQSFGIETSYEKENLIIKDISLNSKEIKPAMAFFAFDGLKFLATEFIWEVLQVKNTSVFIDIKYREIIDNHPESQKGQKIFYLKNWSSKSIEFIQWFFANPQDIVRPIGITGTNGKTTIGMICFDVIQKLKKKAAYCGTLGMHWGKEFEPLNLTSPDIITLYRFLNKCVKKKIKFIFIEVSSHALDQNRFNGIIWQGGVFTNLTQDHLDYHKSMLHYYHAKKKLFEIMGDQPKETTPFAIINNTGEYGKRLVKELGHKVKLNKTSLQVEQVGSDLGLAYISQITQKWGGFEMLLQYNEEAYKIKTKFVGLYNMQNIMQSFIVLSKLGFKETSLLKAIAQVKPPKGRVDILKLKENRIVVIDYAHTPDALENILLTLTEMNPIRIICLFGCGGNRDKDKRPMMGKVATKFADFIILTNDNPRNEDPQSIVNGIKEGITTSKYVVTFDRQKAIQIGLQILGMQEVLLIAGKGHEDYQIIKNEVLKFDDKKVVLKVAKEMHLK